MNIGKSSKFSLLIMGLILLTITGCAFGVVHKYDGVVPDISLKSDKKIVVGVWDRRPYILSKNKSEDFVGLSRGGYGNPFDVKTASGKSLASRFRKAISEGLRKQNIKVEEVEITSSANKEMAKSQLIKLKPERVVVLTILEWKSDTYSRTALIYNIRLEVFDKNMQVLATRYLNGRDNLGGSINPPDHSRKVVPKEFQLKLEEIFGDPKIIASLN